jgi:hypothetical protein
MSDLLPTGGKGVMGQTVRNLDGLAPLVAVALILRPLTWLAGLIVIVVKSKHEHLARNL